MQPMQKSLLKGGKQQKRHLREKPRLKAFCLQRPHEWEYPGSGAWPELPPSGPSTVQGLNDPTEGHKAYAMTSTKTTLRTIGLKKVNRESFIYTKIGIDFLHFTIYKHITPSGTLVISKCVVKSSNCLKSPFFKWKIRLRCGQGSPLKPMCHLSIGFHVWLHYI